MAKEPAKQAYKAKERRDAVLFFEGEGRKSTELKWVFPFHPRWGLRTSYVEPVDRTSGRR
jgi:hypothetical protein